MSMSNKQAWESFELTYVGNVREVVKLDIANGKPSAPGGDPGVESYIQPSLADGVRGGGQTYNPDHEFRNK